MPTLVKICGLKTLEMLDVAIAAGADLVGFVHFAPSPRHLELSQIKDLVEHTKRASHGRVASVVLTVDADDALVQAIAHDIRPDYIQLHGSETPARLEAIKSKSGLKTIKALGVDSAEDLARLKDFARADMLLLDAKPKASDAHPGGNGRSFDWGLLQSNPPQMPYMLSGGLTLNTISDAVKCLKPMAVDVSSGVESQKGVKDAGLIKNFIAAVRSAEPS